MILVLTLIGFFVGTAAAVAALLGGGGVLTSLVAYSFFGTLAVLMAAIVIALAPTWSRRRSRPTLDRSPPILARFTSDSGFTVNPRP